MMFVKKKKKYTKHFFIQNNTKMMRYGKPSDSMIEIKA